MALRERISLGLFFLLVAGCAPTVVHVRPDPVPSVGAPQVPGNVALYVSEDLTNYRASRADLGWMRPIAYPNLGRATAAQFESALTAIFPTVEVIRQRPPSPPAPPPAPSTWSSSPPSRRSSSASRPHSSAFSRRRSAIG
jgi:hypothetical protein